MSLFQQSESVGQNRSWLAMALGKAAVLVAGPAGSEANVPGASGSLPDSPADLGDLARNPRRFHRRADDAAVQAAGSRPARRNPAAGWEQTHA